MMMIIANNYIISLLVRLDDNNNNTKCQNGRMAELEIVHLRLTTDRLTVVVHRRVSSRQTDSLNKFKLWSI